MIERSNLHLVTSSHLHIFTISSLLFAPYTFTSSFFETSSYISLSLFHAILSSQLQLHILLYFSSLSGHPSSILCPWDRDTAVSVGWTWAQGSRSLESRISEPPDRFWLCLICLLCPWQYAHLMFWAFWSPENPCNFIFSRDVWNLSFTQVLLALHVLLSATLRRYFASDVFSLAAFAKKQGGERKHAVFRTTRPRQPRRSWQVSIFVYYWPNQCHTLSCECGWWMGVTMTSSLSHGEDMRYCVFPAAFEISMLSDIQPSTSGKNHVWLSSCFGHQTWMRFSEMKNMNQAFNFQSVHYLSDWCHPLV